MVVLTADQVARVERVEEELRKLVSRYLIWERLPVELLIVFGEELKEEGVDSRGPELSIPLL